MQTYTIRDSAEARQLLAQGLWWQRVLSPTAATVRPVLTWAKEVASAGNPLPPIGFLADLGHVTFSEDWEARPGRELVAVPHLPMNVVRTYEDHVLGKVYADGTFGRASDALKQYPKGRDQARGLAYFVNAFRERAKFDSVEISLGVLNALLEATPEEILTEGYESRQIGPHPLLADLYDSLIQAARRTPEVLAKEDLFDLESKAALEELGQRLAHRQVLRAAAALEAPLPKHKIRPLPRRMEVPTRILEEDMYPVGGFTSLSNRGSIESLLHSQLAYMEPDRTIDEPDLFDTLFLMDELLYYSRDENQFLRRRRTMVIALAPDIVETRLKDFELPFQRGVMLMGLLYVLVRKLTEWLSTDALHFHFLLLGGKDASGLAAERAVLEKLFHEERALEVVHFDTQALGKLAKRCEEWSRKSMVHVLMVGARPPLLEVKDVVVTRLTVNGARPELGDGTNEPAPVDGDDAADAWAMALQQVLMRWV